MSNHELIYQIRAMQEQEVSASYRCTDYISLVHNVEFSCMDRRALCGWGFKIIAVSNAKCNGNVISRTTAVVAISFFDRFLSSHTPSAMRVLSDIPSIQLAFVACLVIALKVKDGLNVESEFVSKAICKNTYNAQEINAMEIEVLRSLGWRLNGPSANDFIDYFFEEMPYFDGGGVQKEMAVQFAKALVEQSVMEYTVALRLPSQIAFAAICCAVEYVSPSCFANCLAFLQRISGLEPDDANLRLVLETMVDLVICECIHTEQDQQASSTERQQNDDEEVNSVSTENSPSCISNIRN